MKRVKIQFERYCYLLKKTIDVVIGSVSSYDMTIAPAF